MWANFHGHCNLLVSLQVTVPPIWLGNPVVCSCRVLSSDVLRLGLPRCVWLGALQLARVTAEGVTISDPFSLNIKWDYSAFVNAVPDKFSGSW